MIAKKWKQHKCPSVDDEFKQTTAHLYNGILLGNIKMQTLGTHDVDRTQEVTDCIILLIHHSHNDRISETGKKLEERGEGRRDVTLKGRIWRSLSDGTALSLDRGSGCTPHIMK